MVALDENIYLLEVWTKEALTRPSFEECLRLLCMCEFCAEHTTIYPYDAELVIAERITFAIAKEATARAMIVWRNQASHALSDAYYADWLDAKLIVIQTK